MIYESFDLETTCLNPRIPANILGVASVREDSTKGNVPLDKLDHFVAVVDPGESISGSRYALKLNAWILDGIDQATEEGRPYIFSKCGTRKYPIMLNTRYCKYNWKTLKKRYNPTFFINDQTIQTWDVWYNLRMYYEKHYDLKRDRINISGKNVAGFDMQFLPEDIDALFRHRTIDTGSVLIDWNEKCVDSLDKLKEKHLGGGEVSHDMLEDAWDVIALNRITYPKS